MKKAKLFALAAMAVVLATPAFARAQEVDNNEIVVTATKRAATIQDVPFSINAQTQEDIERTGSTNLEDLARNVAGLSVQNLGPGQSQVAVRGVSSGQIVRDQPGVKEQVGVYLDESVISLSLFTPDLDLFDLNRVETLRGPQGTLFGSGSVGGTVRYITNAPEIGSFGGTVEANLNDVADGEEGGHLKGVVNIPLGSSAALRLVGYHTETAGFIDARLDGGAIDEDINRGQRTGLRAALRFEPNATFSITPRVVVQKVQTDGFNRQEIFNLFANPFTTTRTPVRFNEREQFLLLNEAFVDETIIGDVTATWAFGGAELTSVTTYTDRNILVSRDASALTGSVSVDLGFAPAGVLLPSNLRDTTALEQWTQELRLASTGEGRFQWLIGAFYTDQQRTYAQRLPTPGYDAFTDAALGAGTAAATRNGYAPNSPYNSDLPYDLTQWAVFGEASFELTDKLTVTAGGRYYDFEEERRFRSGGLFSNGDDRRDQTQSDGFNPRVIVSYDVTPALSLNAQAAQGFRLGGVNDPLNVPLCTPSDRAIFGGFQAYRDETLWNYEVGGKFSRGGTGLNVAAYYTDIEDLQVTLDAGSCSSRIVFNVPEAHTAGIETELYFSPAEGWDVSLSGTYIEAEFDSTVRTGTGAVIGGLQEGNRLASVPEYTVSAAFTYTRPVQWWGDDADLSLTASFQGVGSRITQPGDQVAGAGNFVSRLPFAGATGTGVTVADLELDPYGLINVNANLGTDTWAIIAYVNNITDENVPLAFDRERGGRARLGFAVNQPRTIGMTLRRSF